MNDLYQEVLEALQEENKEKTFRLCIDALKNKAISVADLYEGILTPALANIILEYEESEDLIWREHVRSGIIRMIIESAYPYVLEERKKSKRKKDKVIVMCPEYENHELGARMVSDFFRIEGYDTTFIGARTPIHTILKAIEVVRPKYLAISVTNFYNLIFVKRTIDKIKEAYNEDLVYILGGRAIDANPDGVSNLGADVYLQGFSAIKSLSEEDK